MRFIVATILMAILTATSPAAAMNFQLATTGGGLKVVVASGDIARGDARRLARALERAERDSSGTKRLYLNSPGGIVVEALRMTEVMDEVGVTTIVRKGTICASACASVLFVSGRYRLIEEGGVLAIHSCFDASNGRAASYCNAVISAHAEAAGVSGATMMALQEAAGDGAVIVFDSDNAACFGLTLKPGARPSRKTPPCVADALRDRR